MIDVKKLNKTLVGFTELRRFDLAHDAAHKGYRLTLTVADKADATLTLHFHDVQNLELNPAGDGFEKLIQLQVEDRARGRPGPGALQRRRARARDAVPALRGD